MASDHIPFQTFHFRVSMRERFNVVFDSTGMKVLSFLWQRLGNGAFSSSQLDAIAPAVRVCARMCVCVCVCVCVNHPFDGSKCFGHPPPYSTLKRKKKQAPRIAKKLGNRRIRLILGVTKAFI